MTRTFFDTNVLLYLFDASYPEKKARAQEVLEEEVGADRAVLILAAIARSRSMSFSFWDALILEAALKGGADRLLTEDLQHGQAIEGLRVEDPFV